MRCEWLDQPLVFDEPFAGFEATADSPDFRRSSCVRAFRPGRCGPR